MGKDWRVKLSEDIASLLGASGAKTVVVTLNEGQARNLAKALDFCARYSTTQDFEPVSVRGEAK